MRVRNSTQRPREMAFGRFMALVSNLFSGPWGWSLACSKPCVKLPQIPRLIFWELTTGCNLRCLHSRASATELSSPDDLSKNEAMGLIDQFAQYAPLILVLTGGEPLFRKDVFGLASYAASRGIKVALATNGTLVNEVVAARIAEAGIVRVAISLDGVDAVTHDGFRGIPGTFEAAIRGMKHLQKAGIPVQINTTVTRRNVHQLQAIYDLAIGLGAAALHTFLLVPVGCGLAIAEEQMVPRMSMRASCIGSLIARKKVASS